MIISIIYHILNKLLYYLGQTSVVKAINKAI